MMTRWIVGLGVLAFLSALFQLSLLKTSPDVSQIDYRMVEPYCQKKARKLEEPYSIDYQTKNQSIDLDGTQLAYYSWSGGISRSEFDQTLLTNHSIISVKIFNNKLFIRGTWEREIASEMIRVRGDALLNQLQLVLHLYQIPDIDITFSLEDEPLCEIPFVYYSVHEDCNRGGFTMPSYDAFKAAFGKVQLATYMSCLEQKYPLNRNRIMKAVWRGASTGGKVLSTSTFSQFTRIQLASLSLQRPDILDAGVTSYVQLDEEDPEILEVLDGVAPLNPFMVIDDFNKYAVILDLDGNAWSDRFSKLLLYKTPILKQSSPWKEYFAHFVEPLSLTIPFNRDLSDLIPKVEHALEQFKSVEWRRAYEKQINTRRQFAFKHLSQLGVLRATAYTLTVYSQKQTWTTTSEDMYTEVMSDMYQSYDQRFPQAFVDAAVQVNKIV